MEVPTPVPKDLSAGTLLALFSLESPEARSDPHNLRNKVLHGLVVVTFVPAPPPPPAPWSESLSQLIS